MHRLSSIVILFLGSYFIQAQSPHGDYFTEDCGQCHNPFGWEITIDTFEYNHSQTNFDLEGVHLVVDCKSCHASLIFNEAPNDCASCHNDVHSMSVGNDCASCHTPQNWLVDHIPELHEENGFPLIGTHSNLSCVDCHVSETNLRFDRLGNECISCHLQDYLNTTTPNHQEVGYSPENCIDCHDTFSSGWGAGFINHNFFPLTLGHDTQDCQACHFTDKFSDASPDCFSCHENNFNNATNPNHINAGFSMDCASCHTTNPGWMPANFQEHDQLYFPIFSGNHQGEWNACVDCHLDPNNYSMFSCIDCHEHNNQNEVTGDHDGEDDFIYQSNACYECHPTGESD